MTSDYIELYKKYRPETWDDVIGQDATVKVLRNAAKKNRIPTGYGMFGPRGCGKTSAARIFAKAINCLDRENQDGNPCNECDSCVAIEEGSSTGFHYVSMANNGSVDDLREIAKNARLRSTVNTQVWILDEIHRISAAAFDALLIPLEDKNMPSHFILCSTEVEKIPVTILSRIQQLKFNLVPVDLLSETVRNIGEKENLELTDSQILAAVRMGRGSVRDTLTSLEYVLGTGEEAVHSTADLLEAISRHDTSGALEAIAAAEKIGVSPRNFAENLVEDLRNLLLKVNKVDNDLVGIIPVEKPREVLKGFVNTEGLIFSMRTIGEAVSKISMGSDGRISLELAVINTIQKLSAAKKKRSASE